MKLAQNFLRGKQKRKLRFMLSDKESERRERTRPQEDYLNTFESVNLTDSFSDDFQTRKRELKAEEKKILSSSSPLNIDVDRDDWENKFSL